MNPEDVISTKNTEEHTEGNTVKGKKISCI